MLALLLIASCGLSAIASSGSGSGSGSGSSGSASGAAQNSKCPRYTDIANTANPLIANFSIDAFLGHWVEIKSHNVPGLTTGCSCTRYNCTRNASDSQPCQAAPPPAGSG